ncbi:DUF3558 domain-containing protein [Saccharomonospora piscinae]|uniref:DUF3558 family protein n=1 Tax=Saccharomonospora piscinae TaxID=687388 RepID=UPI001106E2DB|nr:DUF3558 family protein [Saccharomonospora piscinae]TLW93512.1 DUF3558 domain-containing protein [Saccharomonospora piscinae]
MFSGLPRWRTILATLALTALTATGCADTNPGSGSPSSDYPDLESPRPTITSSEASEQADADIDPCSLLSDEEIGQFGEFDGPSKRVVGSGQVCTWQGAKETVGDQAPLVNLVVRDNVGLSGVVDMGDGLTPGATENTGRALVRTMSPDGCLIAMKITSGSRLDVDVAEVSGDDACDLAGKMVEIVDTRLPRG